MVLGPQKYQTNSKNSYFLSSKTLGGLWRHECLENHPKSTIEGGSIGYTVFTTEKRSSFPVTDPASSISGHYNGFSVHPCRGRGLHIHREARVSFIERLGRSEFRIEIHFGIELNPNFGSRSIFGIELNNFGSRSNFGWISIIWDRGPISD